MLYTLRIDHMYQEISFDVDSLDACIRAEICTEICIYSYRCQEFHKVLVIVVNTQRIKIPQIFSIKNVFGRPFRKERGLDIVDVS